MKLLLLLLSPLLAMVSGKLSLMPSSMRALTTPRTTTTTTTPSAASPHKDARVRPVAEPESMGWSQPEKLRVLDTRSRNVKKKKVSSRESEDARTRKVHTKIVEVPKPFIVHVEKPYPVYVPKPIFVEKHLPIKLYIKKKYHH